jgi:hypothetical protein
MINGYDHPKYGPQAARSRAVVNLRIGLCVRMFKWAVEQELIPVTIHHPPFSFRGRPVAIAPSPAPGSYAGSLWPGSFGPDAGCSLRLSVVQGDGRLFDVVPLTPGCQSVEDDIVGHMRGNGYYLVGHDHALKAITI